MRALLVPLVILAWLAVLIVVVWLLSHVARTLLLVVLAVVVAYGVTPLVNLLARRLPRGVALGVAYVAVFVVVIGLLSVVVVTLAAQSSAFVKALPAYLTQTNLDRQVAGTLAPLGVTTEQVDAVRGDLVARLQAIGGVAAGDLVRFVRELLTTLADAVLVLMLSVYLVAAGPRTRSWLNERVPPGQRPRLRIASAILNQVVGGYVRGTLTMALLIGALVGVGMGVLQVRYALLLGVVAFFMAFIPILGTFISGALCVVVALFQSWVLAVIVLLYFIGVHILEGDVIGPRVFGSALGIHPAVALIAFLAGTELFGFWGALFGAPLAGLIQAVAIAAWREYRAGLIQPAG